MKYHPCTRRHHSRRGRVVADGPAQIAAAVARHHRHRPYHPAMARTRRGANRRRPPARRRGTGAELDRLNFPVRDRIENPQPERGMFSSILCAAHWHGWRREIASWAIVLGDQPHLRTETLRVLLEFMPRKIRTRFASRSLTADAASGDFAARRVCGIEAFPRGNVEGFFETICRPLRPMSGGRCRTVA